MALNPTHDPARRSWVASANAPDSEFPIQNLPFGVFEAGGARPGPRPCVAIGDRVLDLARAADGGLFRGDAATAAAACSGGRLNRLMALGPAAWSSLRRRVSQLLAEGDGPSDQARSTSSGAGRRAALDERQRVADCLVPREGLELLVPAEIGDYTDFYASVFHAANVGALFRPDQPLLPNYKYVPIAYHGRASSIVPSGQPVRRPHGQARPEATQPPVFGPSARLDYELELGWFIGPGNALGTPIDVETAGQQLCGFCLVNDWSARDLQAWEYQPLGPFLAKSFATTVSPWIVTAEALEPFRVPPFARPAGDPAPLPHLDSEANRARGGVDITFEVLLSTEAMRARGLAPVVVSRNAARDLYWTPAQMVAHHASNGCNLRPGDLIASGTISGAEPGSQGCLLELTRGGAEPLRLPNGEERRFLHDGDEVIFHGRADRPGLRWIGFGECRGRVIPRDAK